MDEVKAGNVAVICIKDMSRIGRNYLQVGFYTEILFPEKGVRFIAVNNNIDSDNPTENEFTPFLNIMNEWYARDTSKKIKAIFRNRMEHGERVSGAVPYGYKMNPEDKSLLVDPEAAEIVKRIFAMAADGKPIRTIGETLTAEKILIPSAYWEQKEGMVSRNHRYHDPYLWTNAAIAYILDRKEYLGHTVLGKTVRDNFKSKKRRKATEDEILFFPDTHEPIVDQDTWDRANRLRKRSPKRMKNAPYYHRLSGMAFCADCGSRLAYKSPPREKGKEWDPRDALIVQAETDPEAAAKLADKRARDLEATQRYYANMQEQAKTDPDAAAKWEAHREYNRRYLRDYKAKKKAASAGKEQEIYDVYP